MSRGDIQEGKESARVRDYPYWISASRALLLFRNGCFRMRIRIQHSDK